AELERVAEKIVATVDQPIHLASGHTAQVTASIGISYSPVNGDTAETLMKTADEAMYNVKRAGKNRYALSGSYQPQAQ
ncbi:MAG: diguanylate cyclase, partial [Candidatus Eremiobacteraeota bacterium]|nr:diguanylate cyclase [Candidatus Eremiobacteraeota bacterium]